MKTEKVRCWKVGKNEELFITYPDCDSGHELICCKNCSKIYAVNIVKKLYIEPDLDKLLDGVNCLNCQNHLKNTWLPYPDNYINTSGKLCHFKRPKEIPDDKYSILVKFPEVFSKK